MRDETDPVARATAAERSCTCSISATTSSPSSRRVIRSVMNLQETMAKALLVDHDALRAAQASGDVLEANRLLQDAFQTDVRPLLADCARSAACRRTRTGPTWTAARPRPGGGPRRRRRGELVSDGPSEGERSSDPGPTIRTTAVHRLAAVVHPAERCRRDLRRIALHDDPWHLHDFYELAIVKSGAGLHVSERGIERVERGTVIFVPPGVGHEYRCARTSMSTTACSARTSPRPS